MFLKEIQRYLNDDVKMSVKIERMKLWKRKENKEIGR